MPTLHRATQLLWAGTPIEPTVYERVQNHALTISANFGTQIMRGTATGYDHIPPFDNQFPQSKLSTEAKYVLLTNPGKRVQLLNNRRTTKLARQKNRVSMLKRWRILEAKVV